MLVPKTYSMQKVVKSSINYNGMIKRNKENSKAFYIYARILLGLVYALVIGLLEFTLNLQKKRHNFFFVNKMLKKKGRDYQKVHRHLYKRSLNLKSVLEE
jgi:uncharacterized membrane-anchored protein YhcB (DUF1043 family)